MERAVFRVSGFLAIGALIVSGLVGAVIVLLGVGLSTGPAGALTWIAVPATIYALALAVAATGFTVVNPNEAQVVQFFGRYLGSIRAAGLHWTWPLTVRRRVTLRVRNFETDRLKVADADGNPVEIAAVVVWRVVDSANAVFSVDHYVEYVAVQAEAAVRHLATSYPYEAHDSGRASLRDSTVVAEELTAELRERVELAGVEVLESRVTHLAYAPEIAHAMLPASRRPQWSPPGSASSRGRSAWSPTLCSGCVPSRSSTSTRSARHRWCPTCWWCSAVTGRCSRWSTRDLSTAEAVCG